MNIEEIVKGVKISGKFPMDLLIGKIICARDEIQDLIDSNMMANQALDLVLNKSILPKSIKEKIIFAFCLFDENLKGE